MYNMHIKPCVDNIIIIIKFRSYNNIVHSTRTLCDVTQFHRTQCYISTENVPFSHSKAVYHTKSSKHQIMEGVTKILIFISGFSHRLNPFIIQFSIIFSLRTSVTLLWDNFFSSSSMGVMP